MKGRRVEQKFGCGVRLMCVGDSLAMPVHWFYRTADISRVFGVHGIQRLEDAPATHPSSIMSLHSTTQGGRTAASSRRGVQIVGDVILKGKRNLWNNSNIHYHHGMLAGDNTLNCCCVRLLLRVVGAHEGSYDAIEWLNSYATFMQQANSHPDTYAESYHRGFFANMKSGQPLDQCGAVTHDTPSIGGLLQVGPLFVMLMMKGMPKEQSIDCVVRHVGFTHPDETLYKVVRHYVGLIDALLEIEDGNIEAIRDTTLRYASLLGMNLRELSSLPDTTVIGCKYSPACYISGSYPSVLYLFYKYCDAPKAALLANANVGGDTCHRGGVLGFLLGLVSSGKVPFFSELVHQQEIDNEITNLVKIYADQRQQE